MFDSLARLADRRARRVGLLAIVFFLLAGALGGSVAERLDPYGADDPSTEAVEAREQLQDAGHRIPAVLVLVDDAPVDRAATRRRIAALEARAARPARRQVGQRLLHHRLARLRLPRRRRHLPGRRAEADRRQGVAGGGGRHRRPARRPSRHYRRRRRRRPGAGQQAGRGRPAQGGDARLPAALPALLPLLPQPRRGAAAGDDRPAGDRRHLPDPAGGERIRLDLDLRPQPDHRPGIGPGDRLQPLHRLPLPRGDRQGRARPGGDAPRPRHRGTDRLLLLADRGRGARLAARLPPALPLLDGAGRLAGRAACGADLADRAARGADPARHPGQRALAALPAAPGRGRRPPRRAGLLVPALALRDAPAGAGRDAQRALPDRPRPALLRHQVQHRRPDRAAEGGERPPGLRHGQRRVPALPGDADLALGRGRLAGADRRAGGPGAPHAWRRRGRPAAAAAGRGHRDPGGLERIPFNSEASQSTVERLRDVPAPPGADRAGRRRDRRLHRLPGQPRPPPADRLRDHRHRDPGRSSS